MEQIVNGEALTELSNTLNKELKQLNGGSYETISENGLCSPNLRVP
jgi:hypothetical protein